MPVFELCSRTALLAYALAAALVFLAFVTVSESSEQRSSARRDAPTGKAEAIR